MSVVSICYITHDPVKTPNSSLGNELSAYYYYINTPVQTELQKNFKQRISDVSDHNLIKFYRSLKWRRLPNVVEYKSDFYHTWSQIDFNGYIKPNYLFFWQSLRPYMRNLYAKNLPIMKVTDPVVHFRCSDTPFNKCLYQHLPTAASAAWMAQQVKQRGYDRIILLSCNKHKSTQAEQQQACEIYTDFYATIFTDHGLSVDRQCNSIYHDFALMVNAPLLVTLNTSSYSFMAGIAKDPRDYISCNIGGEMASGYVLQPDADWIMDNRAPLLHKNVSSYTDTKTVLAKLIE